MGLNADELRKQGIDELYKLSDKDREIAIIRLLSELVNSVESMRGELLNSKLAAERPKVYTDEELYNLKQNLSWSKLSERTGIPISTLQSKCRRFRDKFEWYVHIGLGNR